MIVRGDIQVGTPEWLAWRRAGIGGSDAPAITGHHPQRSATAIFLDKTGLVTLERPQDEPRYWGKALEGAIIERFERDTGLVVVGTQVCVEADPPDSYRRATIDGLVSDERRDPHEPMNPWPSPIGLLEIKTASRRSDDWSEGVPFHVQIQVQHSLDVTGLSQAWVAVLLTVPVLRFDLHEVGRDDAAIEILRRREAEFWQRVQEDRPPPPQARDVDALRAAYAQQAADATIDLGDDAEELIVRYREGKALEQRGAALADQAEAALLVKLGAAAVGTIDGEVVVTCKPYLRAWTDMAALRAKHPKLVARFTSDRRQRGRFTVITKGMEEDESNGS